MPKPQDQIQDKANFELSFDSDGQNIDLSNMDVLELDTIDDQALVQYLNENEKILQSP